MRLFFIPVFLFLSCVNSDNVNKQEIIQTFDLMGRPISNIKENQIIFILFDNGSVSKKIKY